MPPRLPRPIADLGRLLGMPADAPQRAGFAPDDEQASLYFPPGGPPIDPATHYTSGEFRGMRRPTLDEVAADRAVEIRRADADAWGPPQLDPGRQYTEGMLRGMPKPPGLYRTEGEFRGMRRQTADERAAERAVAMRQAQQERLLARRDALMQGRTLADEELLARRDRLLATPVGRDSQLARRDALMGADLDAGTAAYAGARRAAPTSDPIEELARAHGSRPRVGFDSIARRRGR